MKKILFLAIVLITFVSLNSISKHYDFENQEQNQLLKHLSFQGRFKPRVLNSYIELVNGGYAKNQHNAVIFPDIISAEYNVENYSFELYITRGAEGAGLALINTEIIKDDSLSYKTKSWEMPNFKKSFGLGIDVYNPQTSAWFDEFGNFYGREEREISLHWDNKEIFKIMSPVEFRATPMGSETSNFDLKIKYITAGALVSVSVNDTLIISEYFIPEMVQYEKQVVFGASTGDLTCSAYLGSFSYSCSGKAPEFRHIGRVNILQEEVFHAGRRDMETGADFKRFANSSDTAIMTLDLGGAQGGLSAWDVGAAIYIIDENNERFEICRYITPYNRAYLWKVDVSDYLPILRGKKKIFAKVDTWETVTDNPEDQKGWGVNAYIDFYSGKDKLKAFEIHNIWSGYYEYGNPENPMQEKLKEVKKNIPKNTKSAKLRITVTGHGMSPNSENSAEFKPSHRTVTVNNHSFDNLLWKTDCYLNPCRPQDGTWKFDRAGWAPGAIVDAWEINLDEFIKDKSLTLNYLVDDYINTNRGDHYPPHHWIEAQLIFYK